MVGFHSLPPLSTLREIRELTTLPFNRPEYLVFGAFGSVAGHELSHSLDQAGRLYDKDGKLIDWWTNVSFDSSSLNPLCSFLDFTVYEIQLRLNDLLRSILCRPRTSVSKSDKNASSNNTVLTLSKDLMASSTPSMANSLMEKILRTQEGWLKLGKLGKRGKRAIQRERSTTIKCFPDSTSTHKNNCSSSVS